MVKILDLTVPIKDGEGRLGATVKFDTPYTYEEVNWQGSYMSMFCHYGTHIDAPNHFIKDGDSIDQVPLESLVGPAAIVDLSDHGENTAIDAHSLEKRGQEVKQGDIAILRTDWSDKHWGTPKFWADGPYLEPSGAQWLVERNVKAVVYDFSEEYAARKAGFRGEECDVHRILLGNNIYNIEYVIGLSALSSSRTYIIALPLKLVGLDGSPSRVIALEGLEIANRDA